MSSSTSLRQRTFVGLLWSGFGNYGASIVRFGSILALGWLLPATDFGLLALAFMFVVFAEGVGELGMGSALVQQSDIGKDELDSAFWFNLTVHVALVVGTLAWAEPITSFLGDLRAASLLRLLSFVFLLSALSVIPRALLIRQMQFRRVTMAQLAGEIGFAVAGLSLAMTGFGIWSLGAAVLCQRLINLVVLWSGVSWRPGVTIKIPVLRRLLQFGGPMMGGSVLERILVNADYFVIGRFIGTEELGYYSMAYQLAFVPLDRLVGLTRRVTFSAFSRVQDDLNRMTKALAEGIQHLFNLALPVVMSIVVSGPMLLQAVYGSKWNASVGPLQILGLCGILLVPRIVETALLAVGRPRLRLLLLGIRLASFVGFVTVGLQYGIRGVAASVLGALAVWALATFVVGSKILSISWRGLARATRPVISAALVAVVVLAPGFVLLAGETPPWVLLALSAVVLSTVFGYFLWTRYKSIVHGFVSSNSSSVSSDLDTGPHGRTTAMSNSVSTSVFSLLRFLNAFFPETGLKNRFRARLLRYRNALPRELMVQQGNTVLQVGMWRTENLARLARCVGPTGRVILVEADPNAVHELVKFAGKMGFLNITVVPKGAFNKKGRRSLKVGTSPTHNRIDGTKVKMLREDFETLLEIEVDTVDNILADQGVTKVDYVEITVNGMELEVLQGMEHSLARTNRMFLAGYAVDAERGEPTNRRTRKFLSERGFKTVLSKRIAPEDLKSTNLPPDFKRQLLEGHVFAWRT